MRVQATKTTIPGQVDAPLIHFIRCFPGRSDQGEPRVFRGQHGAPAAVLPIRLRVFVRSPTFSSDTQTSMENPRKGLAQSGMGNRRKKERELTCEAECQLSLTRGKTLIAHSLPSRNQSRPFET